MKRKRMGYLRLKGRTVMSLAVTCMLLVSAQTAAAQRRSRDVSVDGREVTILVTVHPHSSRTRKIAETLQPGDFSVREEDRSQEIISAKRASEVPLVLAVLIQDDLLSRVNNEIRTIKEFIRRLPEGSHVMTGYLTVGDLTVTQDFTTDLNRAASSLRIVRSSRSATPFNPYLGVIAAVRRFESQPVGRRMVLLISDGLDDSRGFRSAAPSLSLDLDRAIIEAQRRGVAVNTIYAPSVGLTSANRLAINYGQGSLNRISDETGGEAFFSGTTFVTFSPYFKELNELMGRQWVIAYRSSNTESGFRRIKVTTEQDVHLHYPVGYRVRDKD